MLTDIAVVSAFIPHFDFMGRDVVGAAAAILCQTSQGLAGAFRTYDTSRSGSSYAKK